MCQAHLRFPWAKRRASLETYGQSDT
jgi:hypothetical protein